MSGFFNSLLDLDLLTPGGEDVVFAFARPIPGWAWLLVIAGALGIGVWSYRALLGSRTVRMTLAGVRALLLLVLVTLVLGPELVQRRERIEQDWVLVLVDRSASMTIQDVSEGDGSARRAREATLRDALAQQMPAFDEVAGERTLVWFGFDASAYELDATGETFVEDLGEPDGARTSIGRAMDQALARAAARPLSAVIVVSDGRSNDAVSRAAMRRLQNERVPVHTVALGSADPVADVAVRRVEAPSVAFVDDQSPVRVELEALGLGDGGVATVRLIDTETGLVLEEREVEFEAPEDPQQPATADVLLTTQSDEPGERTWAVEVETERLDLIASNDRQEVTVSLVDRPMRVLYLDGYPRWERRYVNNLLLREKSITSSGLLLAPDRRYLQEGDVELDALPDSPEAWAEYDAVIIGDMRPDVFTSEQLEQLREHIAIRGAGLVWMAGPGATPTRWLTTPLADLLPVSSPPIDGASDLEPVTIEPAPAADRLGVMRLSDDPDEPWPAELLDPDTGWSLLRYAQRFPQGTIKPTAETLALARGAFTDETHPAVLSMKFGAGRVLYVATDETWRWRYARGEVLFERFWVPMLRLLGRESLARSGRSAVLDVSPRRATLGEPVRVAVELLDQSLVDLELPSIEVRLERRREPGEPESMELSERLVLPSQGEAGRTYASTWFPPVEGAWTAVPVGSTLADAELRERVEVALPNDELRRPETDHPALASLSSATSGLALTPASMGEVFEDPGALPSRERRIASEVREALWDTPLALIVVLSLLTLEWVARRLIRLL